MQNSKAVKAHFKNFTMFVNAKEIGVDISGKRIRSYSINNVSIKNNTNGVTSNLKERLTEKQIGKLLTTAGYPSKKDGKDYQFGKAMRQSIKSVFEMNNIRDAYIQNGSDIKDKESAYSFVETTGGIVKIWIIDVDYTNPTAVYFADRASGTITCIVCKESKTERSTCDIYQEIICDNNGREGRANPFAKGNYMTHHINHMNKVEKRGGARKVVKPIEVDSTLVENNVATVEIKEVVNQHADVINEQQAEIERLKAMVAQLMADKGVNSPVVQQRSNVVPIARGRYDRNDYLDAEIADLVGSL